MNFRSKGITTAIVLLLAFATSQVYLGVSFAGSVPTVPGESAAIPPQQTTGILTTQGSKEITVNGANAISGATIVSGASIETPAGVEATVSLGTLGSLHIEPGAKLTLEFAPGTIKVMLIEGCVTLHTNKGTAGEIDNSQGVIGKTDPAKDGKIETCPRRAAAAVPAAGAGGLGGLSTAAALTIFGGIVTTAAIVTALSRGGNPSPAGL
jgi:hypothetical protein